METPVVVTDVVVVSPQFAFVLTYFIRLLNEARSEDERAHTEGVAHKDGSQRKAQARQTGWKWRITHNTNLSIRGQKNNLIFVIFVSPTRTKERLTFFKFKVWVTFAVITRLSV